VQIRSKATFALTEPTAFQNKILHWLKQCNIFCLLQSNLQNANSSKSYDLIAGINRTTENFGLFHSLEEADSIIAQKEWLFGHMGYNLYRENALGKNQKPNRVAFAPVCFFIPEIILYLKEGKLTIESIGVPATTVFEAIESEEPDFQTEGQPAIPIQSRVSENEYINDILALKNHIQAGDCYEINYCIEFYNQNAAINPYRLFSELNRISPNAFNAFYKNHNQYLLCASPERFLKKTGHQLISQPIKGTIFRDTENAANDAVLKETLRNSTKEQSENIMIVDLVRNDLSKVCKTGTVTVEELFGVYSFAQVHHLISTVSGTLTDGIRFSEIIGATFPMGSMTGAPKIRVMELIELYEKTNRGIFSGSIGYIRPDGDFDLNVVIRSIMYNAETKFLNYLAGSGITINSDPKLEYEECLLKAKAIEKVLGL
jgi:para-aminobenzoate synthetase component 1